MGEDEVNMDDKESDDIVQGSDSQRRIESRFDASNAQHLTRDEQELLAMLSARHQPYIDTLITTRHEDYSDTRTPFTIDPLSNKNNNKDDEDEDEDNEDNEDDEEDNDDNNNNNNNDDNNTQHNV